MAKKQWEVLNVLDGARTQWYHFSAVVIAGMGFFTDAYDLFCISTVTKLLGRIYYFDNNGPGLLPAHVSAAVNAVALCGALAGQLFFGWMGDKLGRKKAYGITLMLMVVASIASGFSFGTTAKSVMTTLCFCRFWLGFGIGGDYPLSATIMSEYSNQKTRGTFIAAVFAMQGFGILTAGAVAIIVSTIFRHAYKDGPGGSTTREADFVWRIILIFGAAPAVLTYYWRMRMPETARFTTFIANDEKRAAADMSRVLHLQIEVHRQDVQRFRPGFGLFSKEFARRHGRHLLGTTSTWFFLDIAFYSQTLFQKDIFKAVGWLPSADTVNAVEEVYSIARAQSIISLCSTVPGYWFTVFFVDRIGRKTIQLMGFFFMTIFMFALAIPYNHWLGGGHQTAFLVLYSFTFFFSNFGPNATTFIVPAEIYPARLRSTCHGISAAAGKAGAIIGAFGFVYAAESTHIHEVDPGYNKGIGIKNTLMILGVTNALGLLCTFLIPETNGKSLEELSREDEDEDKDGIGLIHPPSPRKTASPIK